MASTSTSSSILVRLVDREDGSVLEVTAQDSSRTAGRIHIVRTGIVDEMHTYDITLLSDSAIEAESLEVSINGGEYLPADISEQSLPGQASNGKWCYTIDFPTTNKKIKGGKRKDRVLSLFYQTYGLARIEFNIPDFGSFTTKDIPCACAESVQVADVRTMLETLLDSGEQDVADWMFTDNTGNIDRYAILEGGVSDAGSKSVVAFMKLVADILDTYQQCFTFMKGNAHSKVWRETRRQPGLNVRQLGVNEFSWLMKNTEVLSEVGDAIGIEFEGKNYFPRYVSTEVRARSYDNYENRVLLSLLDEIITALRKTEVKVNEEMVETHRNIADLDSIRGNRELPALIVMEECARREGSFVSDLSQLRARAQHLLAVYKGIFHDVEIVPNMTDQLRRTKVFQEVKAYAAIYRQAERWHDFGDFSLARESLALHAMRLDKLYEYYALFRLLEALHQNGYSADISQPAPIERAQYTLVDQYYEPEETVNTLYHLVCKNRHLRLYYQPVIYGDDREENGITLHRKSSRSAFDPDHVDSYWTPDYLLVLQRDKGIDFFILDAKYNDVESLKRAGRGEDRFGRFNQVQYKYETDVIDTHLRPPTAVWLLAGREENLGIKPYHSGSWASRYIQIPPGIAPLSPTADSLDELFALFGIIDKESLELTEDEQIDSVVQEYDGAGTEATPSVQATLSTVVAASSTDVDYLDKPVRVEQSSPGDMIGADKLRLRNLDGATTDLVVRFINGHERLEDLYKQPWSSKHLKVNHPVLRKSLPRGGRERQLYERCTLSFGEAYLYIGWRPNQLELLKRIVAHRERSGSDGD